MYYPHPPCCGVAPPCSYSIIITSVPLGSIRLGEQKQQPIHNIIFDQLVPYFLKIVLDHILYLDIPYSKFQSISLAGEIRTLTTKVLLLLSTAVRFDVLCHNLSVELCAINGCLYDQAHLLNQHFNIAYY
jgi:hypothetical protein